MTAFDKLVEEHQTEWRGTHVATQEWGQQNGVRKSWILPSDLWEAGLWSGIGKDSDNSLSVYLERAQVQKHTGAHNLKSSWVLCANLYFPFGVSDAGKELFASFLKQHVATEIDSLDRVELEYAESEELHPVPLLGEEGGSRGSNQTSPDLGLLVNGGRGLILVENKFTEHDFYQCSAWKHKGSAERPGNPDPDRCNHAVEVARNPSNQCHQTAWSRRYWDHLAPVVDFEALAALPCCPAAKYGYQLFRQQALAEGIAHSEKYDLVVSAVAVDERNKSLDSALRRSGIADLRQWGTIFNGKAKFVVFTHQQWVRWVREHDDKGLWNDWQLYIQSRYGLGE